MISGWAKGNSAPNNAYDTCARSFGLTIILKNGTNEAGRASVSFNPHSSEWQDTAISVVATDAYNTIVIEISYDNLGPKVLKSSVYGTFYYVTNAQGDVMHLVNSSGTTMVTYTYDAWGNILSTSGAMGTTLGAINPLRYRGYVYDTESGLYYLQSRYYNPELGRFINADAFVSTGQGLLGSNMFAYCGNNPACCSDPSGYLFADALGRFRDRFCVVTTAEACCGIGAGITFGVAIGRAIDYVADSADKLFKEIERKISNSLTKADHREYRSETEVHHIAAKKALKASQAAAILNEVLPGGIEDELNKVELKTSVHRRVHTNLYYSAVNYMVVIAYNQAAGNPQKQYANIISALGKLETFLLSLNALAIN